METSVESPCPHCTPREIAISPELEQVSIGGATIEVAAITSLAKFEENSQKLHTYLGRNALARDLFTIHPEESIEAIQTWESAYRISLYEISHVIFQEQFLKFSDILIDPVTPDKETLLQPASKIAEEVVFGNFPLASIVMDALHLANVIDHRPNGYINKIIRNRVAKRLNVQRSFLHNVRTVLPEAAQTFADKLEQ